MIRRDMNVCRWLRCPLLLSRGTTGNHTRMPWPPQKSQIDSLRWCRCDSLNQIHSTQEAKQVEVWMEWELVRRVLVVRTISNEQRE